MDEKQQRPVGVSPGKHALRPQQSNTVAAAAILQAMLDEVALQGTASHPSVVTVFRSPLSPFNSSASSFSGSASSNVEIIENSDTKIFPKYSKGTQKVPVFNKINELWK